MFPSPDCTTPEWIAGSADCAGIKMVMEPHAMHGSVRNAAKNKNRSNRLSLQYLSLSVNAFLCMLVYVLVYVCKITLKYVNFMYRP